MQKSKSAMSACVITAGDETSRNGGCIALP